MQLQQEEESLRAKTQVSQLVIQEMQDFQAELKQIKSQLLTANAGDYTTRLHSMCSDLAMRFPTLYSQYDISYSFAAMLLKE